MLVRPILAAAAISLALLAAARSRGPLAPLLSSGCPIAWEPDVDRACERARCGASLVLVQVARRDRPLAARMDREVFGDPRVAQLLREHFACVRIEDPDAGREAVFPWREESVALASFILDAEGRCNAIWLGAADPASWLAFAERALERAPAIASARARLAGDPSDARARLELGGLLLELGCRELAEENLDFVVASGEDAGTSSETLVQARERLARLFAESGQCARAREQLCAWSLLAGASPSASASQRERAELSRALVLRGERRTSEAVAALEGCLRRDPGGLEAPRVRLELASVRHELGEDALALTELSGLADLAGNPQDPVLAARAAGLREHIRQGPSDHRH
jgi:thioredoxin-like negative regulator of GroEL